MIKKILFLLFFISGFCALLYQTVWLRLAFADFGVNTQVISVVVSVFMLGLVLGSFVGGRYSIQLAKKHKITSLYFYAFAEAGVGLGAFLVPKLFSLGHNWLLSFGETNSTLYLALSALVLSLAMLPWCFLMGTTIPLIMDYINRHLAKDKNGFSFLYLANTFGAMAGTLITALILIESLGFKNTLFFAACLNFLIATMAIFLARKLKKNESETIENEEKNLWRLKDLNSKDKFILGLLFTTGFSSVGFEVIWNRLFTPILETSVYAFAFILFMYLLGTCFGLLHYRSDFKKEKVLSVGFLLIFLSIMSVVQIWFVDPRFHLGALGVMLCIGSISYLLGYLTPKQIDELSEGNPNIAGLAYAINLLGCILGPLLVSYVFLPLVGSKFSIILMSLPLFIFFFKKNEMIILSRNTRQTVLATVFILILITTGFGTTYEEWLDASNKIIKNDYNATTLAATLEANNPRSKYLMVNGVGMTMLTPITKVMAHLPLFALPPGPKNALVVCFGMGTTFRSVISWGIPTTAVELTPSVGELFPYFFDDTAKILADKNNKIVIDDGRRFLERTTGKYDLVAIDPPPPVISAGSSLLYSEEFYQIIKTHLTPSGILAQWYPEKNDKTLQAVARSLVEVFPHVEVYKSITGNGYHFLASNSPIVMKTAGEILKNMPLNAQADLMEWNDDNEPNVGSYINKILDGKQDINELLNKDEKIKVTDDQPYNEYFFLRNTN